MKQTKLTFYLKRSSILNKIIQLAVAIGMIVLVMNLWVNNNYNINQSIENHFQTLGQNYLAQSAQTIALLSQKQDKKIIESYFENITQPAWISDIIWYDATGQVILSSKNSLSIKSLYGIDNFSLNRHQQQMPFMQELRHEKLEGYLRITLDKSGLTADLTQEHRHRDMMLRAMIVLAGMVGFFLTRSFNRFSRQGFRIKES